MNGIKVGIVEDEMVIAQGISDALEQLGYTPTEPALSYTEALEMVAAEQPDILLIDIQLSGKKDGIDLAWKIREDYNIPFIFLTANSDPATVERAKKVCPPAYLVKPFNKDELYTSIETCLYNFTVAQQRTDVVEKDNYIIRESVFIKQGQSFQKVSINDILYIESDNVYIHVHTAAGRLLVRSTLQSYLDLIASPKFFRVHRRFVVNLEHIDAIHTDTLTIAGAELPIGKTFREELLAAIRLG